MDGTLARKPRLGRIAGRGVAAALLAATVAFTAAAQPAAAASFDPRIQLEHQITCQGNTFGLTPQVRIVQPWVIGTRSTYETIKWMPYLQRYVPSRGWVSILRSTNWLTFSANNRGPNWYWYTYQPRKFVFDNLTRGYYYRIIHVVQWTSTGELGSKPSDYRYSSGHCLLQ